MDRDLDALTTISQSQVLTTSDFDRLVDMQEELMHTLDKSQMFRTRTEMDVSVLNDVKHPTAASKYWQSMREQNVHFHELVMLSFDYREKQVEYRRAKDKLENPEQYGLDEFDIELLGIEIQKLEFIMLNQRKAARERMREISAWSEIKSELVDDMAEEDLDDVDNHQLKSYTKRWILQTIQAGNSGSPAERYNLMGQLRTGILSCIKKGLLMEVLRDLEKGGLETRYIEEIKKQYTVEILRGRDGIEERHKALQAKG